MKKEVWKGVPGRESEYEVSSIGRVKSLARWIKSIRMGNPYKRRNPEKMLTHCLMSNGYLFVGLGREHSESVHRLVAMAFVPNPLGLPEVNHKDGNKKNNYYKNLEWTTHADNQKHAGYNGLMARGNRNGSSILTDNEVRTIKEKLKNARRGTIARISREFGVNSGVIEDIKNGKTWGWCN